MKINILGVCGGGGDALNATLTEKRINAVASITGVNIGRLFWEDFSNHDPLGALEAMAAQRTREARGGNLQVNELLPASPEKATEASLTEIDVYEATEYYKSTARRKAARPECCSLTPRIRSIGMPSPSQKG